MKVACSSCGTQHSLPDGQLAGHARVQFRCGKCGKPTLVEVGQRPDATRVISPLPEFARSAGAPRLARSASEEESSFRLPEGKSIALSILAGPARGLIFPVLKPKIVLGRAGADLAINDSEISRWHCSIEVKDDVVRLRDLDSTNGTFYEEERVRAAQLVNQAEFRIGETVIRVSFQPK